jgi:hypothetical protein
LRNIRFTIPSSVAAVAHYAAQIAGCSVQDAYACLLLQAVSRMTQEEAASWVKTTLPTLRAALASEHAPIRQKGA